MDLFLRYACTFCIDWLSSSSKQPLAKACRNVTLFIVSELHFIDDAAGLDFRLESKKVTQRH